ncbi:hypothetical protein EHW99_2214 [Erwinia amylovora]|nr:hypothetical protein EHX00_2214 [Erwinia amylovora]QJQ58615.1 hypothetical protein EHW99_2214 [Erwinia amylovora]QJQ62314.1 hypothetical protein EHW98_2214 [Erwinia amylovora]QJQ66116.1 hypothetical protein EHW96_2214 [Erwinia amylovora]QJQ69815.1 hypothetical protein EGZ89_2214 [Erwinia amylovora]
MKFIGIGVEKRGQDRGSVSCHGAFQHPLAKSVIPGSKNIKSQEYNLNMHLLNLIAAQLKQSVYL